MNELIINNDEKIENLIYEIRGVQVMLDSDLAKLYQVETKRINEAVSRNIDKFPERFCFRITEKEFNSLKPQIATSKGGSRKGHSIFTEQGVAMRKYIGANLMEHQNLYNLVLDDHKRIDKLENTFKQFEEKTKTNEIYFDGQIYDAYSKILEYLKVLKKN